MDARKRRLQQRISTAASADGRRLLTVQAEGPELHVLDHRLESVQVLTCAPPQDASASGSSSPDSELSCVRAIHAHIDDEDRFLVAAASAGSVSIHFWQEPRSSSLFQTKGRNWRAHSTLTLALPQSASTESGSIITFDLAVRKLPAPRDDSLRLQNFRNRNGNSVRTQVLALIGSTTSISLWSLPDSGAPTWRREWFRPTPAPVVSASLTQDAGLAAAFVHGDTRAMVWSITAPHVGGSSGFRTPSRNSGTTSVAESVNSPELQQGEDRTRERPIVRLIDRIQHSRALISLEWRRAAEGPAARSDPLLITQTTDGSARIWATVIDQPLQFRLWSSVLALQSPATARPVADSHFAADRKGKSPERVFYLGAQETTMAFRAHIWELEKELMRAELGVEDFDLPNPVSHVRDEATPVDQQGPKPDNDGAEAVAKRRKRDRERDSRRTRLQRLQQIVADTPDIFLTVHHPSQGGAGGGVLELTAVANVDRSPPTLFQNLTISHVLRLPSRAAASVVSARLVPMLTPASIATLSPRDDGHSRATAELVILTENEAGAERELRYAVTPGLLFDGDPAGLRLRIVGPQRRRMGSKSAETNRETLLPLCHPRCMRLAILWGALDLARHGVFQLDECIKNTDPEDMVDIPQLPTEARSFTLQIEPGMAAKDLSDAKLIDIKEDIAEHAPSRRIAGLQKDEVTEILRLVDVIQRVQEKQKGLDHCGQRFVTALTQSAVLSEHVTPPASSTKSKRRFPRVCLSGADAAWAAHSAHQAKLIQTIEEMHGGRLTWSAASGTSLFLWLRGPPETIRQHAESLARAQYTHGSGHGEDDDQHDPTRCSMLYYALGKHKLVLSLWRQAAWHPDQQKMVTFLSKDFTEDRWRTAALKNAFALMSKRKFELAGAFFLLGGSLKDATNVCARNLEDVELAVAVARIAEGRDDGPVLQGLLRTKLLPLAFERGDRGLASLGFGLLGQPQLEREVLVTPSLTDFVGQNSALRTLLGDVFTTFQPAVTPEASTGENDDLSALLLYNHLQKQPDQPFSPEHAIHAEARDAVLRQARELRRQGCDIFALRLVLDWQFPQPQHPRTASKNQEVRTVVDDVAAAAKEAPEGTATLPEAVKSKLRAPPAVAASDELSSSLWDSFGAPSSAPTSTSASATVLGPSKIGAQNGTRPELDNEEPKAKKTGLGTLMKPTSTAQVHQGGADFDMSAFGF
ncbi:regulator of (H+)-ATPase in vacuolar membrane [Tilletia horrida]|nr:regulator of (H+)-ATPase in vacuolar membrane [Tilletia horrida]